MLTLGLCMALVGLDPSPPIDRSIWPIYGGKSVPEGHWPEIVGIKAGDMLCTGTLIAPRVVLTAAHCFATINPNREVDIFKGSQIDERQPSAVSRDWGQHPDFCGASTCKDKSYDYAYINLPEPIELGHYPRPVATQKEWDQLMKVGKPVWLIGFGATENDSIGKKRIVGSSIESFSPKGLIFLTSGGGKDSCVGDSGGPAMLATADGKAWRLAGVLSSGTKACGGGGYYGVPIAVLDWLEKETSYRAPKGACTDLECLDTSQPAADSCALSRPASRTWSETWLVVLGFVAASRQRNRKSSVR